MAPSPQDFTTGSLIKPFTPDWLNGLPVELRIEFLRGEFGLTRHNRRCEHVAWISWSFIDDEADARLQHEGAFAFVLDCGQGPFVVTAGYVYDQTNFGVRQAGAARAS